jgi:hypothetical protein
MSRLLTVLERAYEAFNARNLARLRSLMHPEATWPNTLEDGALLVGKEAVMGHFGRIFATMTPNIHVIDVIDETIDALTVDAQYSVESRNGHVWSDTRARLTYHFRDGLLTGMTILSGL